MGAAGLDPRTNGYTDAEVIEELQRVATKLGRSPSRAEFKEHGRISVKAVQSHFGSWDDGLRVANLETTTQRTATEEDVITTIQDLAAELGRPPKAREMENHGAWSVKVAQRCFGRWNRALRCAGFEPHKQWSIKEEQLQQERALSR